MTSTAVVAFLLLSQVLAIELPTSGLIFHETFDDANALESGRWVKSSDAKYAEQQLAFLPHKEFSENLTASYEGDLSLVLGRGGATYYAVSTKFSTPIDNTNKDLVIQYDLMLEENLACGGAYIKLLRENPLDLSTVNDKTPYSIMFGPDKCGATNKVHFILQHQNPINHKWEEKHFKDVPQVKNDRKSHLYTLHIKPNNDFDVYIDKAVAKSGNLLTDMTPPVNPPKMIDDPTDKKPVDWVDEAEIADPTASKPDDWDEEAPMYIEDEEAEKPAGWLDDAPAMIADPASEKPEDWDDEEDGEWEAPLIANPACEEGPGCGEWTRPKIRNPEYKGKWRAPMIENPAYIGEWSPRQIENPDYFVDEHPHNVAPITGLAVEVMTTNPNIRFDNFVVGHSLDAAFKFADATMKHKLSAQAQKEQEDIQEEKRRERAEKLAQGGILNQIEVFLSEKLDFFAGNPIALVGTLVAAFVGLLLFVFPRSGAKPAEERTPAAATEERDESPTSADSKTEEKVEEKSETSGDKPATIKKSRSRRAD